MKEFSMGYIDDPCGVIDDFCGLITEFCGVIAKFCGVIAKFCGVIADFCGVITDPCDVVAIPEAIGGRAVADAAILIVHITMKHDDPAGIIMKHFVFGDNTLCFM